MPLSDFLKTTKGLQSPKWDETVVPSYWNPVETSVATMSTEGGHLITMLKTLKHVSLSKIVWKANGLFFM